MEPPGLVGMEEGNGGRNRNSNRNREGKRKRARPKEAAAPVGTWSAVPVPRNHPEQIHGFS